MLVSRVFFYLSVLGIVFAFGLVVGVYQIFPYQPLKFALNSVETVLADRQSLLSDLPTGCRFADRCPKVEARCREKEPVLEDTEGGGQVACFHPN